MADLITLANLKTYLFPGETNTTYDTILETIIDAVSARVRGAVGGCDILTATYTKEEITGRGTKYLYTKHWPITSVTMVTDQDGNTYVAGHDDDYSFDDYSIISSGKWLEIPKYYIVTYVAGYSTLPSDLTLLCYELCMERFKAMKDKWAGEASRSFPDGSVSLFTDKEFTKDQQAVINSYRRPRM